MRRKKTLQQARRLDHSRCRLYNGALLLNGSGCRGDVLAHIADGMFDRLERLDHVARNGVETSDLGTGLVSRRLGLRGKILDLRCDHREPASSFRRALI